MIGRPQDRNLEREELRRLALEYAGRPELWRHLVRHDPDARIYEELHRDDHLGIWLICWMKDHDTGFHDHDISSGALAVADGKIREERLGIGGIASDVLVGPGGSVEFGAADIHRVTHGGGGPAVTIHAYSPPLWRMGAYEIQPTGQLLRHSVSYAEELRPVESGSPPAIAA
ncbi:MAG TPA: cysteine dioxygenase family protein [Solirubrobacterales bacterium]|nr:cysteine dioxygenase family protein [Solirubrobacterales bacterium]